jgi:hypothetical protein
MLIAGMYFQPLSQPAFAFTQLARSFRNKLIARLRGGVCRSDTTHFAWPLENPPDKHCAGFAVTRSRFPWPWGGEPSRLARPD